MSEMKNTPDGNIGRLTLQGENVELRMRYPGRMIFKRFIKISL